jgi:LacI family transcriptional regulator
LKALTIKDIAKALNTSVSTVSRALRDSSEINPETKQQILDYIAQVNYVPNPMARSLKENRSRSIGVILPELTNNFFSQAINGIEETAYLRGYHVVISQSHESLQREIANTQYLVQRKVDGILASVASNSTESKHFQELINNSLPIVFFDRVPQDLVAHKVIADNFEGGYKATEHLIKQGYKHIAHLTSSESLHITNERMEGYKKALLDYQIPTEHSYIKHCQQGGQANEEVEQLVVELLEHPHRPDAIFISNDRITISAMLTIKKHGLRIPEDIAVVGFTNLITASLLNPSLSVIVQPAYEMGKLAAETLLNLIEKPKHFAKAETKKLITELTVRESSGKLL